MFQGNQWSYYLDVNYAALGQYDGRIRILSLTNLIECGALYNESTMLMPRQQLYHVSMDMLCTLMPRLCSQPLMALLTVMQLRKTYVVYFVQIEVGSCHVFL